jgi:HlyD family secretion protein
MRVPQGLLRKLVIAFALLAVAGAIIGWGWRGRNGHDIILNTVEVKRGDLVATIRATGTVEPVEVVDVGAQVAGLIKAFGKDRSGNAIDYGSVVEEGTVLAKIDDSVYAADFALAQAQVEQDKAGEMRAVADLEQSKAKADQTEADWKRAQELTRSKLMSQADYDSYKANYEAAKANVSVGEAALAQAKASTVQAQALLEKAQRNLDFCTIKSPVKGVIIDRRVNIGQTVVASLNAPSLFLIAKDLTKMQIWVAVNEADIGRIVPGAPVTFTCDTFPGREFDGTVGKVRLNATMTQNVVMYTVEVNTENPDSTLLPYLTANVRFVVHGETNALLVPNAALRWTPSLLAQVAPDARSWKPADPEGNATAADLKSKPDKGPKKRLGTVWLKEGEFVRPVEVKAGASDGADTAIESDALREGQEVVTGETVKTAQSGTQNPFVPQFRRR